MANGNQAAKYVAVGCGVVLLLSCCFGGAMALMCSSMMGAPHGYSHGFMKDLREGRPDGAYQRMGAGYRSTHDMAAFQRGIAMFPPLTTHHDFTVTNLNVENDTANVAGNLTTAQGSIPVALVLSKAGEFWYVEQVNVAGQPMP